MSDYVSVFAALISMVALIATIFFSRKNLQSMNRDFDISKSERREKVFFKADRILFDVSNILSKDGGIPDEYYYEADVLRFEIAFLVDAKAARLFLDAFGSASQNQALPDEKRSMPKHSEIIIDFAHKWEKFRDYFSSLVAKENKIDLIYENFIPGQGLEHIDSVYNLTQSIAPWMRTSEGEKTENAKN